MIEINSAKKAKQHTVYKNKEGKRVPGVTTITGILNKPALVPWANKIGLQGIEVGKYVDDLATIGTLAHKMVEDHINKITGVYIADYTMNQISSAETSFLKYLHWEDQHEVIYQESEIRLISESMGFGGTLDILAIVDGELNLIDLKTCKGIYKDHFLQVGGGYGLLAKENGIDVKDVRIIRIGRSEAEGIEAEDVRIPNIIEYQQMFILCLSIYKLKKKVGM